MKLTHNMSLKNKLLLIIMGVCTIAIFSALLLYSLLDIINYRNEVKSNAILNATLVGEYCEAPLVFGYKEEAEEVLTKLKALPDIINACIYDTDGKIFAQYSKNPNEQFEFPSLSDNQLTFYQNYIYIFKPIISDGTRHGTVYLRMSVLSIGNKILNSVIIIVLLIIGLSLPIYFIGSRLQRLISNPIMDLARITDRVSRDNDYSIKVETDRTDVIGFLYTRFNDMLSQINARQKEVEQTSLELHKLNEELEDRVNERTEELSTTNNELISAKEELEKINAELTKEIESHHLTEKELLNSQNRLENILNHAPILVYINNLDGRYVFVNREFEKLMGLSAKEIIYKTDAEIFPEDRAERNIRQNKKVIEAKEAQIFENKSVKKDGIHYFIDILFPIFDSDNEVSSTCGWSLDITDRKKSEEVLREAKEKAESADRLKSAFLATMSHELRTPLNSIIGFTGILMKGLAGPLNDEQLKQLGMAKGSAQHLLALINDVLDISKIESGQLVVTKDKFDFINTLEHTVESVKPLAEKKNLVLQLEIFAKDLEIDSDERRVGQILLNIINNAIKFTEKGYVRVECKKNSKFVVTKVIDTGIGINQEDMDKLFKPFSQVDTGLTRKNEGTGLGLSISKKLAKKLGGNITVESVVGEGSTFTIELPLD